MTEADMNKTGTTGRKMFCLLLAALMMIAIVLPVNTGESFAEPAAVFPTYKKSSLTDVLYMNPGDKVQMQFQS